MLARERGVVAPDEAAAGQHAHLPVEIPGREELALDALGHGQEVDLLVLVPVDEVPRLALGAGAAAASTALPVTLDRVDAPDDVAVAVTPAARSPVRHSEAASLKTFPLHSPIESPGHLPDAGVIVGGQPP